MMEIIGIIGLLGFFGAVTLGGYGLFVLTFGMASAPSLIEKIFAVLVPIVGICGFIATIYYNIDISVKG
jgi:hypothetical protein